MFSLLLDLLLQPFTKSYSIIKDIGSGSFGTVLLARNKHNSRLYAAKFIKERRIKEWVGGGDERVPLEIHILSRLSHPNVVGYAGCCRLPQHWVLIMDYLGHCVDLRNYMRLRGAALPEPLARLILAQTHDALSYCLSVGVDHRDVKCQNILIDTTTLQIRLIDFGLASLCDPRTTVYTSLRGTGLYLPPEALVQQRYTPLEALSWSLGCLLYCMLTARNPFTSKKEVVFGDPPLPDHLSPNCRDLVVSLLDKVRHLRIRFEGIVWHPWFQEVFHQQQQQQTLSAVGQLQHQQTLSATGQIPYKGSCVDHHQQQQTLSAAAGQIPYIKGGCVDPSVSNKTEYCYTSSKNCYYS